MSYPLTAEVSTCLAESDLAKVVERTAGYSGSDMKNLIQEACQGPVRDLFRTRGNVANVTPSDLRPVQLRDFQVGGWGEGSWWAGGALRLWMWLSAGGHLSGWL